MKNKNLSKLIISITELCIVGTCASYVTNYHINKTTVQALDTRVSNLKVNIAEGYEREQRLAEDINDLKVKLSMYEEPIEYIAAEPPYYDIPLSKELQAYTYNMCSEYGVVDKYELMLAVMWKESNFTENIVSSTNDYGIMQINKCNHSWLRERLGVDNLLDAKDNIYSGVYILASLFAKYDNDHQVLMSYNMGEGGALNLWKSGIYSSSYSRDIVAKRADLQVCLAD